MTANGRIIVDMTMITIMSMPVIIIMIMTIIMALTTASAVPGLHRYGALWRLAIAARQEKLAPGCGLACRICVWPSASEPARVPRKRQARLPGSAGPLA